MHYGNIKLFKNSVNTSVCNISDPTTHKVPVVDHWLHQYLTQSTHTFVCIHNHICFCHQCVQCNCQDISLELDISYFHGQNVVQDWMNSQGSKNISCYIHDIISSKEVVDDIRLHLWKHFKQIKFEKCFLPCSSETFVFSSATKKFKILKF